MKAAEKDKPIHTIPKGVWEGGIVNERKENHKNPNDLTTDSQGNGYPVFQQKQENKLGKYL